MGIFSESYLENNYGYINESAKITKEPEKSYDDYETNLNFKGTVVEIRDSTVNQYKDNLDELLSKLDSHFRILKSNYSKIEKEVFEYYLEIGNTHWDMNIKSISELMRYATLDNICYRINSKGLSSFDIWYNNKRKNQNETFFEYHSLNIILDIDGNNIKLTDKALAG